MIQTDKEPRSDNRFDLLDCTDHACNPPVPSPQPEPQHRQPSGPLAHRLLLLRNCAVVFAAMLFSLSLLNGTVGQSLIFRLKAVAYFFGAAAYGCEYLILTNCCKHKPARREMLMSNVFGIMYIILGISYFNH